MDRRLKAFLQEGRPAFRSSLCGRRLRRLGDCHPQESGARRRRLCRLEVRDRGLDGIAAGGGRAILHRDPNRRSGLFPNGVSHRRVDELRHSVDRGLRHRDEHLAFWKAQNGKQSGDPAKLAQALIALAGRHELPRRFIAGTDSVGTAEQKVAQLQQDIAVLRELSTSLAFDEPFEVAAGPKAEAAS